MAEAKSRRRRKDPAPLAQLIPAMLDGALARSDDFVVTCETDPDTGARVLHVMSGRFVSPCMLRKLIGQAESQRDEGGRYFVQELPGDRAMSPEI